MKQGKLKYDLEDRLLGYATQIFRLVESLPSILAGQLLLSCANFLSRHGEAQAAESHEGFRHKMMAGLKVINEIWRWLRLSKNVPLIKSPGTWTHFFRKPTNPSSASSPVSELPQQIPQRRPPNLPDSINSKHTAGIDVEFSP